MRIPYVVGRWVRGQNHYGRQRLVDYLLTASDSATWLVGTRRMGKTSLLRQLELITTSSDSDYVPLIWDLQGCQSPESMSVELEYAIADVRPRFESLGIKTRVAPGADAVAQLRSLSRNTDAVGKRLLLLIDEAEALLYVSEKNPGWLAMLRKALHEGSIRSIITSTKLLARLNESNAAWTTSPFLFGFNLANLWQLEMAPSLALIRQDQAPAAVIVNDEVADDILNATNGHPYLIQHLCQRLFTLNDAGQGTLRPIRDEDLNPDHILAGFFRIDFQYLTEVERRLMLTAADLSVARSDELMAALSDKQPRRIEMFLYGLRKLGYLRASHDRWTIGNEYLRRWIQEHRAELDTLSGASIEDTAHEEILRVERRNETNYLRHEIERLQAELFRLEEPSNGDAGSDTDEVGAVVSRLRMELVRAHRELDRISGGR